VIKLIRGNLLKQDDVDAIVNTVNCVGVMGKGIALQFKHKWPANFKAYAAACKSGEVRPGRMFVFDAGGLMKPSYIINFPTKDHWRGKSTLEFVRAGMADLVTQIQRLGIRSIAVPPLGCGNGGLDWATVRPVIEQAFEAVPDVEIRLFEPAGAPAARTMEVRTPRPRMTPGRAIILKVLESYRGLNYGLSKIEVQKLAYFLQEAGGPLDLEFSKQQYGPYSDALRHALNNMEGHFIRGVGDGVVEAEIEPVEEALAEASAFIAAEQHGALAEQVARVSRLIDGYQSSYGMELLASVHWVASREVGAQSLDDVISAVHAWNERKRQLMTPAHIATAWRRLNDEAWLRAAQ